MISLICTWTKDWANNRNVDDLRRHRAHYIASAMQRTDDEPLYEHNEGVVSWHMCQSLNINDDINVVYLYLCKPCIYNSLLLYLNSVSLWSDVQWITYGIQRPGTVPGRHIPDVSGSAISPSLAMWLPLSHQPQLPWSNTNSKCPCTVSKLWQLLWYVNSFKLSVCGCLPSYHGLIAFPFMIDKILYFF